MPVKFKIYYACVIYLLVWALVYLSYIFYMLTNEPFEGSEFFAVITFLIVFIFCIAKAVASIGMVRHLKNNTQPSKAGRILFVVLFATNILAVLLNGLVIYFIIGSLLESIPSTIKSTDELQRPQVTWLEVSAFASIFIAGMAAIFIAVFDFVLLRAIRLNHEDIQLSFEADIKE